MQIDADKSGVGGPISPITINMQLDSFAIFCLVGRNPSSEIRGVHNSYLISFKWDSCWRLKMFIFSGRNPWKAFCLNLNSWSFVLDAEEQHFPFLLALALRPSSCWRQHHVPRKSVWAEWDCNMEHGDISSRAGNEGLRSLYNHGEGMLNVTHGKLTWNWDADAKVRGK